jgi:hypothetical protein
VASNSFETISHEAATCQQSFDFELSDTRLSRNTLSRDGLSEQLEQKKIDNFHIHPEEERGQAETKLGHTEGRNRQKSTVFSTNLFVLFK